MGRGPDAVTYNVQVPNVATLESNSPVMIDDVVVGSVGKMTVQNWHADVEISVKPDVVIPANAVATVGQTSLLGSMHLALNPPLGDDPTGRLQPGSTLPLNSSSAYPTTEQTLSSLSTVANGGGLGQIGDIIHNMNTALSGREPEVRELLTRLDNFVRVLAEQRENIIASIQQLRRVAGTFANQREVIDRALKEIPPAIDVLIKERPNFTTALGRLGQFSNTATQLVNDAGDDLVKNLENLGPVLGALAATYAIAEMQKSGWGSDNNAKNYAKDFALFGGTAGVVVLDRLFGHNRNISNDAQGITGTFDASGFSGQSFQEKSQKGGTFSKDKRWTDYGAIGADMDKALDSMLKQAVSGVQTIGKALNVETEAALEGFSHTFALQLSENGDMSKAGEKIAAELKKVQDELVTKLVPNIEDFARYGESAADTFGRLNQEVTATDAILLAMGKNAGEAFGAVGLASIKAREDLIDLAGGLDKLASKTQAFYQAYYSSSEQQQLAAKQAQQVLVTGFADIGQSIPASRAAFRGLVEAQDLSTEAGRKLWNSLLDLSDEFDTV